MDIPNWQKARNLRRKAKEEAGAAAEEAAVRFLSTQSKIWGAWVSDDARKKLSALIK